MKTFWLIVTTATSPRILAHLVKRVDGTRDEVIEARNGYADELGDKYLVTAEPDSQARQYKSYRRFSGSDREAY